MVERLADSPDVRVLTDPRPFNWAALNNAGALEARGDVLLFLNNDIEAHRSGWLSALCAQALRPDVGAAGARLLYPDRRLQHCGLVVGLTGAAGHVLGGLPEDDPGYLHMATAARECSAVTGACLATRRAVFELLGGFDETLGVDLNDVDYCLRAADEGPPHPVRARSRADPSRVARAGARRAASATSSSSSTDGRGTFPKETATSTHTSPVRIRRADWLGPGEEDDWNRWYATLTMQ